MDTFPKLLMRHALERGARPAMREKDLGIWQTWTWRAVADEVARAGVRPRGAGLQARRAPRHHRRQPAAPLLARCARRRRSAASRCRCTRTRSAAEMVFVLDNAEIAFAIVEDQEQVDKLLEIDAARAAPGAHLLRRPARHAPLPTERLHELRRSCRSWAANSIAPTRASSTQEIAKGTGRRHRGRCCTPRARPASRRACARRTQRCIAAARGGGDFDKLDRRRRACCRTCRWRGSATTCSRTRRRWSPASRSTAPSRPTR